MRGAGLRRYTPNPQSGSGFVKEVVRDVVAATTEGFKKGYPNLRNAIRSGYAAGKAAASRAVKRKADEFIQRKSTRVLNDLFGS